MKPSLSDDERFKTSFDRVANREKLDQEVQNCFSEMLYYELVDILYQSEIAFAPFNDVSQLSSHPLLREIPVLTETGKQVLLPAEPARRLLEEEIPISILRVPKIGEDTDRIRSEFNC